MRLVDRQILRDLVAPFFFGAAAFTSVFFAGSVLVKLSKWMMNGMGFATALKVVILSLPTIVVYTLPMATLLAVLLGVGRLSGDSEIVALFAGGVSFHRLVVPIIVLGVLVSLTAVVLEEAIAPRTNLWMQEIQAEFAKQIRVEDRPFTIMDPARGLQITVLGGMDVNTGVLKDVTIIKYGPNGPRMVWHAERAEWAGLEDAEHRYDWKLYDGWTQLAGSDSGATTSFSESRTWQVRIPRTPKEMSLYQKDPEQMTFSELSRLLKQVSGHPDRPEEEVRRLDVDRWNKLALPLSSLVFAMLAAPLGVRPHRSSSSVGLGLSIFLIFVYWLVWRYTSALAIQGTLAPVVGAFLADALGVAAALLMIKRAAK